MVKAMIGLKLRWGVRGEKFSCHSRYRNEAWGPLNAL